MTTTLFLRIASAISLIFALGHTAGGLRKWSPMGENEVLKAMTSVRFDTMGANRSYLDFFMGFGWSISAAMLMETILLWQMASLARTDAAGVRPMIAVFAIATIASGVIAWCFIFPMPALFSSELVIALAAAYVLARNAAFTAMEGSRAIGQVEGPVQSDAAGRPIFSGKFKVPGWKTRRLR